MIKEVTYYDIICDKCGAKMTAEDSGWITIGENHYCSDCYEFIEINDMPKKGRQSMSKTTYCGECKKFLYEDINGFGICGKNNEVCYCGDKCHLTHGRP